MTEHILAPPPAIVVPTTTDLFLGFFKIAISGFGGVLAWARRIIVQERHWMTAEEFNELFALCQFLPGPNIVNFSLIYGSRMRGAAGAAAAVLGLDGPADRADDRAGIALFPVWRAAGSHAAH